jgi:hypothetical protein
MRNLQRIGIALVLLAAVSAVGLASPDLEKTPQAKAFRAQMKAIAAGDYEAYKKVTTADTLKQMDSQLKQMGKTSKDGMELMKMMSPTDIVITAVKVEGKKATLSATGKSDGTAMKGSVDMAEEDGQWKGGKQSWSNAK